MRSLNVISYIWHKITKIGGIMLFILGMLNYCLHFMVIIVGIIQLPFLIPVILIRIENYVPRKYRYRMLIYLEIL